MEKAIEYIIQFLLRDNLSLADRVGYTDREELFSQFDIVILPSGFFDIASFGNRDSEPQLPLADLFGTPLLFGENRIERQGNRLIVHADIIASTFYLISRYEETLHPNDLRDTHGRFIGKNSLAYRAGFLQRPIVDEYSDLLIQWLAEIGHSVQRPPHDYKGICLTHDIDTLTQYRHPRGVLGGIKRNLFSPNGLKRVFRSLLNLDYDPAFTFPWMMQQDATVEKAQTIYFVKAAIHPHRLDMPAYSLDSSDARHLFSMLKKNGALIGLHTSYTSGVRTCDIPDEKGKLELFLDQKITLNRWHFLRTQHPSDFESLIRSNITDDYTMGYADVAGFRLSTTRPVKWINPRSGEVTNLTLHPLSVMDCTLSNEYYMNLSEEEAYQMTRTILQEIKKHNGEVVLLWHNTIFSSLENNYHRSLYSRIINELKS